MCNPEKKQASTEPREGRAPRVGLRRHAPPLRHSHWPPATAAEASAPAERPRENECRFCPSFPTKPHGPQGRFAKRWPKDPDKAAAGDWSSSAKTPEGTCRFR